MPSYCDVARTDPVHGPYHDTEYGRPLRSDAALLERLALEINQAGLSWTTILKKQANFRAAFDGFDPAKVAAYSEGDIARLLADAGIIRNRLKVNAVIEDARRVLDLRAECGSFAGWLDAHHPLPLEDWTKLFKRTFRFTGGEIVREFLVSTGYLPGAHDPGCPIYAEIACLNPPWMKVSSDGGATDAAARPNG